MQFPRLYFSHFVLLFICYQIGRKLACSNDALNFLKENAIESTEFEKSNELRLALYSFSEPPAILLLNKHALNITLNFLCNLQHFSGALDRVLVFAFDAHSHEAVKMSFPKVKSVHYDVPALHQRFSATDGRYQLFQLLRARLCAFLARHFAKTRTVPGFWMIQSDTIWRTDFFNVFKLDSFPDEDMIFDSEGDVGLLGKMIAGGYFYSKSSIKNAEFFEEIGDTLMDYYVTDNNLMGKLCLEEFAGVVCGRLPYSKIVNWRWRRPETLSNPIDLPLFVQFDGGAGAESKFQVMARVGADFIAFDSLSEKPTRVQCNTKAISDGVLVNADFFSAASADKANPVIRFFHQSAELVCSVFPSLEYFALTKVFPFWAYYLVV
uniref:Nucleotid_trans domain-containing protein n=1 Tax=Panagrellus redivivus TaxID=6233 RepID=A0A7E4WBG4_PANRE